MAAPVTSEPSFTVNHKTAVLVLTCWAVWTQVKDGISAWVIRDSRLAAVEASEATTRAGQDALKEKVLALDAAIQKLGTAAETIKGDVKASQNLNFTEQANQAKDLTRLDGEIALLRQDMRTLLSKPAQQTEATPKP